MPGSFRFRPGLPNNPEDDKKEEHAGVSGGNWPENEYTKQVPMPDLDMIMNSTENREFTAVFAGATMDAVKAYVEQVKAAGFTIGADTEEMKMMGMEIYSYTAKNADGYHIEVAMASGMMTVTISK